MKLVFSLRNGERYIDKDLTDAANRFDPSQWPQVLFYEAEIGGGNGRHIFLDEVEQVMKHGPLQDTEAQPIPPLIDAYTKANSVIRHLGSFPVEEVDEHGQHLHHKALLSADELRCILALHLNQMDFLTLPKQEGEAS